MGLIQGQIASQQHSQEKSPGDLALDPTSKLPLQHCFLWSVVYRSLLPRPTVSGLDPEFLKHTLYQVTGNAGTAETSE